MEIAHVKMGTTPFKICNTFIRSKLFEVLLGALKPLQGHSNNQMYQKPTCNLDAGTLISKKDILVNPKTIAVCYCTFKCPSFCIGWRLLMLVFCLATWVTCTNIHNSHSSCERLASADVDWCTAMKSEHLILVQLVQSKSIFLCSQWF